MPPLKFLGKKWGVASDDFVFVSIVEELIQFSWVTALAATFFAIKDSMSCDKEDHMKNFYYVTLGLEAADFILTLVVLAISMRGTIRNSRPRRHMTWILAIKLLVWIASLVWISFSTERIFSEPTSCGRTLSWIVKWTLIWSWFMRCVKWVGAICFLSPWTATVARVSAGPTNIQTGTSKLASYGHQTVALWEKRVRKLFCCVAGTPDSHTAFKDVGKIAAEYFDVDLVQSDVLAGLMLVLKDQLDEEGTVGEGYTVNPLYNRTLRSRNVTASSTTGLKDWMTIDNMAYYMRYAIACYGSLVYVARNPCSGPCRLCCNVGCLCCCTNRKSQNVIDDDTCKTNLEAIKNWTNLKDEDIIYFNMSNEFKETPFFVAADPHRRNVVVALRGTWSANDGLADLGGRGTELAIDGVTKAYCHEAMLHRARRVEEKLLSMDIIGTAFNKINNEGHLIITGHSLGSGVASILAILLKVKYPEVKCYAFSPMGCSVSPDLSEYTKDFICSATVGTDMIARTDMYTLTQLKVTLLRALRDCDRPKYEILARGWQRFLYCCCLLGSEPDWSDQSLLTSSRSGTNRPNYSGQQPTDPQHVQMRELQDAIQRAESDLLAVSTSQWPLKLPGRLLHIVEAAENDGGCCSDQPAFHAHWVQNSTFERILLSSSMLTDHLPGNVLHALENLSQHQATPLG